MKKPWLFVLALMIAGSSLAMTGQRERLVPPPTLEPQPPPDETWPFIPERHVQVRYRVIDTADAPDGAMLKQKIVDGDGQRLVSVVQLPDGTYRSYFVSQFIAGGYAFPLSR